MRLVIIPEDSMISIDGKIINGCDMSWIPEFIGNYTGAPQKVHALQWFDDHGEIELKSHDLAIPITELGIFEQAVTIHTKRILAIKAEQLAAKEPTVDDQEAQQELLYGTTDIDIDQLLAELEKEIDDENVGIASTISAQIAVGTPVTFTRDSIDINQILAELEKEIDDENVEAPIEN